MLLTQGHNERRSGQVSNQGPLGPLFVTLTNAPVHPLNISQYGFLTCTMKMKLTALSLGVPIERKKRLGNAPNVQTFWMICCKASGLEILYAMVYVLGDVWGAFRFLGCFNGPVIPGFIRLTGKRRIYIKR